MYADESKEYVLKRLDIEPIRYCDGRYSIGFIDVGLLTACISDGTAELYDVGGMRFVKRVTPLRNYHGYAYIGAAHE